MNYLRIYNNIIHNAQNRALSSDIYKEHHHIIPRCCGGTNNICNIIQLTAKEHFVCHHLLTKIHHASTKLKYAFWMLCNCSNTNAAKRLTARQYPITSTVYANIKSKLRLLKLNKKRPAWIINKIKATKKYNNSKLSLEERKLKYRNIGMTGQHHTAETKARIKLKNIGKFVTLETRNKISQNTRGPRPNIKGKNNSMFIGWFVTPAGRFDNSREAAKANGFKTHKSILDKCRRKIAGYSIEMPSDVIL